MQGGASAVAVAKRGLESEEKKDQGEEKIGEEERKGNENKKEKIEKGTMIISFLSTRRNYFTK